MDTLSHKRQATSFGDSPKNLRSFRDPGTRVQIIQGVRHNVARQYVASSIKLQASSNKQQATSNKPPESGIKQQASSVKR